MLSGFWTCHNSNTTEPSAKVSLWTSLDLNSDTFSQVFYHEDGLYVSAGRHGVFVQTPAFFGEWKHIGLEFPEFDGTNPRLGVNGVTFLGERIFASAFVHQTAPNIFLWSNNDSSWAAVAQGVPNTFILSMISLDDRFLLVSTFDRGYQRSSDGGTTWSQVFGRDGNLLGEATFQISTEFVYAGWQSAFFTPFLHRSDDHGLTWEDIVLNGLLSTDGRINSIGTDLASSSLYICVDSIVYVSMNGGDTFAPILQSNSDAHVVVNPFDADEVWVASDSLYVSHDAGRSWQGHSLPPDGQTLGKMAVDWKTGLMVVAVWFGNGNGTIYCVDMSAVRSSD